MFNWFWKHADNTHLDMPRPKESVKTKIHQKWIDKEVQQRQSRKLQLLINSGMHTALPKHCIGRIKKIKHTWSSSKI